MYGSKNVEQALGIPLDVFNSSSISMSYALKMMELWDKKLKKQSVVDYGAFVYESLYKKIGGRRTGWTAKGRFKMHEVYGWRDLERDLAAQRISGRCDFLVPVDPYEADGVKYYKNSVAHLPLKPYGNFPPPSQTHLRAVRRK